MGLPSGPSIYFDGRVCYPGVVDFPTPREKGRGMTTRRWLIVLALSCAAAQARAEDAPTKRWSDEAGLSFTGTTGNSDGSAFEADNLFRYDWARAGLELKAGALTEKEK